MRVAALVLAATCALSSTGSSEPLRIKIDATQVVDLTQPMHEGMAFWLGGVPFWHARFNDPKSYVNADAEGVMHFPGYGKEAAELLVERDVVGIGIDTLSLDNGPSKDFGTHVVMLKANKYQIENMANLDALPPTGAVVSVAVLPVRGGSQAQARIFVFLP